MIGVHIIQVVNELNLSQIPLSSRLRDRRVMESATGGACLASKGNAVGSPPTSSTTGGSPGQSQGAGCHGDDQSRQIDNLSIMITANYIVHK